MNASRVFFISLLMLTAVGVKPTTAQNSSISTDHSAVATPVQDTNSNVSPDWSKKEVKVPDVLGLSRHEARRAIEKAGLEVGEIHEKADASVSPGHVISEHPSAGTTVQIWSKVNLVVAEARDVKVPDVIGLTLAEAEEAIRNRDLDVGRVTEDPSLTIAAGLVIREHPHAGTEVKADSRVHLVVSSGPAKVTVPNVVGISQSAATTAITGVGLTVGTVTAQSSSTVAAGFVSSESPVAGSSVVTGSVVNLVVSTGMVLVPNVVGLTQAGATTSITGAGLKLGTVTTQTSTTVAPGLVISESPAAGMTVTLGSNVNLVVSSGGQTIPTAIGASVPAAASGLITTFYSASTTVPVGGAIPTLSDGSVPMLFAGDGVNDPLLLAVGSTTGTLDANTTAIGLVRTALGLVVSQAPLTSSVLASAIQASPNYPKLLSDITASLTAGQSPLDSDIVAQDALTVAQDTIVTLNTNGVLSAATAKLKAAAAIQVNPPLPYYFINNSEPYNRLFLSDDPGTTNVNAMNQTFIAWQFDTSNSNGPLSSGVISQPLKSTSLQLIGYYGGSATTTPLLGASPEFTLTLSQSTTTKNQNVLSAINQFGVFLASVASGSSPSNAQLQCFSTAVSAAFGPQLAALVAQPTGATAVSYFESILSPVTIFKLINSCSANPSSVITTIFGKGAGKLWTLLNLVKAGVSTLGTASETFTYWDFPSQDYLICKTNGGITSFPCVTLQIAPAAPSVAVGGTIALTATASNSSGSIPTPPNLQWSSDTKSVATADPSSGVVTGVSAGTATITVSDSVSGASASTTVTVSSGNHYEYYFPFQGVGCGVTVSGSIVVVGGGQTFADSKSYTNNGCGPGSLGQPDATFGPTPIALHPGTSYTVTFSWTGDSLSYEYLEIDAYSPIGFLETMAYWLANSSSGQISETFTAP